jgi:glycosyltransferase involved in cell wall biosynthesis
MVERDREWNKYMAEQTNPSGEYTLELSILMPCLNEAETLEICIQKALRSLRELDIAGEVIIADNGSTDGSQDIATRMGARVVPVVSQRLRQRPDGRHHRSARSLYYHGRC